MQIKHIAKICHQANKAYCEALGDNSQLDWEEAPEWQRNAIIKGVEFCLANPLVDPSLNHFAWFKNKEAEGWKYGPVKDVEKKEHPCMVDYHELPISQQLKDTLIKNIVLAFLPSVVKTEELPGEPTV